MVTFWGEARASSLELRVATGHGAVVGVGEVEGVVHGDVVELHVETVLLLAVEGPHQAHRVIDQEAVGQAGGRGTWLEGRL